MPAGSNRRHISRRALLWAGAGLLFVAYAASRVVVRRYGSETEAIRRQIAVEQRESHPAQESRLALPGRSEIAAATGAECMERARVEVGRNPEAALRWAEGAMRKDAPRAPALQIEAQAGLAARRFAPAIRALRTLRQLSPGDPELAASLGFIAYSLGWTDDARALLAPFAKRRPANPNVLITQALIEAQANNTSEAENAMKEVVRLSPTNPDLWTPLIHLYIDTHRAAEAKDLVDRALLLQPGNPALLLQRGIAAYRLGDAAGAREWLARSDRAEPGQAEPHYFIGLCALDVGDRAEAARELENAVATQPGFAQTRLLLGRLWLQMGRRAEGAALLAEFERARRQQARHTEAAYRLFLRPHDPAAHRTLAALYRAENLPGLAEAEDLRAAELPGRPAL